MKDTTTRFVGATLATGAALAVSGIALADEIIVDADITTSTTWTADNTYNLDGQIYVKAGATLTIEAGTLVASSPTENGSGSLAVCRGSQINVQGTADAPVIMTSTNDDFQTWREACNEWGNLTIMGNGFIGYNYGGAAAWSGAQATMEGLVPEFDGDPNVIYGGTNDNDDSGSISYLSLRYGGRVVGLTNELNGLSLGAIGRATTINNVEIMNNVDDGIELWGGTVDLKNCSIWNIGDDSVDADQGYRGTMQNIFVVQGYSAQAKQGSGVGDNGFEFDGAEDSDAQPRTRAAIYNATFVGQPDGDGATAWRDGAGVQYINCIIMDCGEKVVRPDGDDGDGAQGYGYNGTATFAELWDTNASVTPSVNASANPALYYTAQNDDYNVCAMVGSVFYNNANYADANTYGVFDAANNNLIEKVMPIAAITRASLELVGPEFKAQERVTFVDPTPVGAAAGAQAFPTSENGVIYQNYSGAFSPTGSNWLCGWSAASDYGFISDDCGNEVLVSGDITTSTTWSAGNVYNLQGQVNVKSGATLTIEAGTVVASTPTENGSGSLAICRGSQINVQGTADAPVIMTSTNDDFENLRIACNEWGNLTIMGNAYIGYNYGGAAAWSGAQATMEGLVPDFDGDPDVIYGGTDDDDNSGTISHLNLRYGGRVVGLTNELNGLSLGAIGRGTTINNVEIMNNVDDGIELWGGTVNLENCAVWNIGDDSIDADQGYRGTITNVLVVQGHSADAKQGSGFGDNGFEFDGAEDSDAQPRTRAAIYNATFIGHLDGDGATAWRDGAGVQYINCIIMDCGEKVVRPDGDDGDGAQGYGYNGTATFEQLWDTNASVFPSVNAASNPGLYYTAQNTDYNVCAMVDSVFYNNADYADADALGVFDAENNNVKDPAVMPIAEIVRGDLVLVGPNFKATQPVDFLDPRPVGTSAGAFGANSNWLCGWSTSAAFGLINCDLDVPCPGDYNGDGQIAGDDLTQLLGAWNTENAELDLTGDGFIAGDDLTVLLGGWGPSDC